MGLLPMTDSSVSSQPLKLMEYPPNAAFFLAIRHSSLVDCWGSCPAPPETAEGIMDGLRGREKRKIQSLGGLHEGKTTRWGYTPRGLLPPQARRGKAGIT